MYIFEISTKRRIFFIPHSTYSKKKSFHLILGSVCTFYELKSPKWKQPLNISENVFYKQVLEFHCPSKFLCQTSGRQNHWSLLESSDYRRRPVVLLQQAVTVAATVWNGEKSLCVSESSD